MKDNSKLTVPELKARAKELNLKGFSKLKKAELVAAVNEAEAPVSPQMAMAQDLAINPFLGIPAVTGQARNKAKAQRRRLRKKGFKAGF